MYLNHLQKGFEPAVHKDKNVVTASTSRSFEAFLRSLENVSYQVAYVVPGYEHRADLISNIFYNTPTFDWLICYFNNISDPFNQLNVGDRILIPAI